MSRPATQGFQKPLDSGKRVKVGMAVISYEGSMASCSCGKVFKPVRPKVLEDRIDKHLDEKHAGKGIRL